MSGSVKIWQKAFNKGSTLLALFPAVQGNLVHHINNNKGKLVGTGLIVASGYPLSSLSAANIKQSIYPNPVFEASNNPPPHTDTDYLIHYGKSGIAKPAKKSSKSKRSSPTVSAEEINGVLAHQAGEDAYFVSNEGYFYGIADGVGGWNDIAEADSAAYSYGLMKSAHEYIKKQQLLHSNKKESLEKMELTPLNILQYAYEKMNESNIIGSTTACIVAFDPHKRRLYWANLGDSGFLLIRDGKKLLRAQEKQHRFNCPYQLGTGSEDHPRDSARADTEILDGDILVLATDGFFDNVQEEEIVKQVNQFISNREAQKPKPFNPLKPEAIPLTSTIKHTRSQSLDSIGSSYSNDALAKHLAAYADKKAHSKESDTPFSRACRAEGYDHRGGKIDDITVVVAEFQRLPVSKL